MLRLGTVPGSSREGASTVKKTVLKLRLDRETLRELASDDSKKLLGVVGGATASSCYGYSCVICPQW